MPDILYTAEALATASGRNGHVTTTDGTSVGDQGGTAPQWMFYTSIVRTTGFDVVVPIYPLAPHGTAATVVPIVADLIAEQIGTHGADRVGVEGDSTGAGLALASSISAPDSSTAGPASPSSPKPNRSAAASLTNSPARKLRADPVGRADQDLAGVKVRIGENVSDRTFE